MRGNCLIVQSGGPTAVINSTMVGIVDELLLQSFNGKIYGAVGGIHGLLNESFILLNTLSLQDRYRLRWSPGAALGTWRYKLNSEDLEQIITNLRKKDVRYLFYIGGNGSMNVAKMIHAIAEALNYELHVIGVPKSIDNDLLGTDHTPGYGSAAKFLATSALEVSMDMASYPNNNRVTIIETMGRHCGWLAGACSLAEGSFFDDSQLLIYIPEVSFHLQECLNKIAKAHDEKRNSVLVIAEGARNQAGQLIFSETWEYDILGRPKLGGVSSYLKEKIEAELEIESRAISASIWQRSSIVLASKTDVDEAYKIGKEASLYAKKGTSDVMIGMKRKNDSDRYEIIYEAHPLREIAGKERFVPKEWYDSQKHTMTSEFNDYLRPIIQGEMLVPMQNGLPIYKSVI